MRSAVRPAVPDARLSVLRALKDDVLHLCAAQMLDSLLAQNPGDGVGNIALAAAIRSDHGGDTVTGKDNLCVVREGFETDDFQPLQFEHAYESYITG